MLGVIHNGRGSLIRTALLHSPARLRAHSAYVRPGVAALGNRTVSAWGVPAELAMGAIPEVAVGRVGSDAGGWRFAPASCATYTTVSSADRRSPGSSSRSSGRA